MKIERLAVRQFRNLRDFVFEPRDGINVIYGKNAQGKTNLLEAMWLFTGGKSFRGARDSEMIGFGAETARLDMNFFCEERSQNAVILIQNKKRNASLNGVEKNSALDLMGKFRAVIFSPEHLSLVKAGPAMRRNFVDGALCQIKPVYARLLYQYNRTLAQRNALLKDIPRHSELLDTLEIWDEKLSRYGGEIIRERFSYLKRLNPPAKEIYEGISRNSEEFSLHYRCGVIQKKGGAEHYSKEMREALSAARSDDVAAGFTTVGPHRDDVEISVDGFSARSYASQGQQRSAVLALKLAEAALLEQKTQEEPVVFLDDVMSELDAGRQDYLLNHLEKRQIFITCCEPETVGRLSGGGRFEMENGRLFVR